MERQPQPIIDLHCHTHVSDNSHSIGEVIRMARDAGVTVLAITDHDTTDGLAEAVRIGKELRIEIIPGIEISATDRSRKRRAHLLGYFVETNHPALHQLCRPTLMQRTQAAEQMVERLIRHGYAIRWEQVKRHAMHSSAVYKQHIMHALMDLGFCQQIRGELEKRLFSRGEQGSEPGVAHIPISYVDAIDAIEAILEAGGIPVLAHPGQFNNFDAIEEWITCGLAGLEAYHPSHTDEDTRRCLEIADRYGMLVTGGSDFHGMYGQFSIGSVNAGIENLSRLKEKWGLKAERR